MTHNLVTGGAGFVGRHLVRALAANGEKTRILDLEDNPGDLPGTYLQGSITDHAMAREACTDIDVVFHLAGNAQLWSPTPDIFETVNHQGTRIMLEAAAKAGVEKFIHCSSLTTLVGKDTPIGKSRADENTWIDAERMLGPYPASKRRAEQAALTMDLTITAPLTPPSPDHRAMQVMIAIPTEPLGAGDHTLTPPTRMILDFANRKTPAYIDCILNFVPVEALATGFMAVRDKGKNHERYLLAGENITLKSLLTRLEAITGKPMARVKMPYGVALIAGVIDTHIIAQITGKPPKAPLTGVRLAGRQVSFCAKKAATQLGWQAGPVDTALAQMLTWADQQGLLSG